MNFSCKFLVISFLVLSTSLYSQNEQAKWSVGISLASAKYYTDYQAKIVGGMWAYQTPRLNISKYIFGGLTLDAGVSTTIGDDQKYTTLDGALRYDFGASYKNVVPYLLIGGSFISAKSFTPTANVGVGNTFWFSQNYGLNMQFLYKYSEDKFTSQFSHIYTSVGLVYSFGNRSMNPRIWESNNH